MSSSEELYNRLSDTLETLVPVKNRKQVTNWIWIIVGMLQSQSLNLSKRVFLKWSDKIGEWLNSLKPTRPM